MLHSWTCRGWCRHRCRWGWVRTTMPITALCDSITVSDFKPGKRGLNSRPMPYCRGGRVGSHTLPNHMTGNGRSTRYSWRVIRPTRRTARNFFSHKNSSTLYLNIYTVFVTGEDEYSRYNYRWYINSTTYIMNWIFRQNYTYARILTFMSATNLIINWPQRII